MFVDKETKLVCRKSKHLPKQVSLPRNCFIKALIAEHDHRFFGHPGSEVVLPLKLFFFWPGRYIWVPTLTKSCLASRKNEQNRNDQNTATKEEWGEEVLYPFRTVQIDQKEPLNPMSDGRHHCLILIDAFLCFNQVYPVKSTDATRTIHAMSTFISSFGIPQNLVYAKKLPSSVLISLLSFRQLA